MTDKTKVIRSNETQRIIQEMLIDIVVVILEKICGFRQSLSDADKKKKPENLPKKPESASKKP